MVQNFTIGKIGLENGETNLMSIHPALDNCSRPAGMGRMDRFLWDLGEAGASFENGKRFKNSQKKLVNKVGCWNENRLRDIFIPTFPYFLNGRTPQLAERPSRLSSGRSGRVCVGKMINEKQRVKYFIRCSPPERAEGGGLMSKRCFYR